MRTSCLFAAAALFAACPAGAEQYRLELAPKTEGALARLKLFADAPVGSAGLYGAGSGAFDLPGRVPASGQARFRRVPVRFEVGGRTFAGFATVTFRNGAFEGLIADSLESGEPGFGKVLRINGAEYAYGEDGSTLTGQVSAGPADAALTPEPSTWATIVIGLGLIGVALRVAAGRVARGEA